jgi:hypothetical protein
MTTDDMNTVNEIKKLWWLHDSFWHAAAVRELGIEKANALNHEAVERFSRMLTLQLLKKGVIKRPESIQELMDIFKTYWKICFFDNMYIHEPVTFQDNTATWVGTECHAYESLHQGDMITDYACGCAAIREGIMKALRLEPVHSIDESLVRGNGRCVVKIQFKPKKK